MNSTNWPDCTPWIDKCKTLEAELERTNDLYIRYLAECSHLKAELAHYKDGYIAAESQIMGLREALEEIQRHHTCSASVFDIAQDALAGKEEP